VFTPDEFAAVSIVDDVVIQRLLALRDAVAKPGEDVLGDLLRLFARDSDTRLAMLRAALAAKDEEGRKNAAHALKGAAGNVGAKRVAAIAAHVEKHAVDEALLTLLAAEVDAALAALGARLCPGDDGGS
jgi:HPt (histidine-containing phosphotransfer) domain-containing protein